MRFFVIAALVSALGGCSDVCTSTLVTSVVAPDGQHKAELFQRDCGATTGFSTQISITATSEKLSGGGNTFQADDDHGAAQAGAWGGPWAEINWLSADHLLVKYAAKSRVFKRVTDVNGVRVTFQTVTR